MIQFKEIYNKAINLFDDPDIQYAYAIEPIRWQKIMYQYLENGIGLFTNPTRIAMLLVDQKMPKSIVQTMVGNGTKIYQLESTPETGSDFCYVYNDKIYNDIKYDGQNNQVEIGIEIPEGEEFAVEWYFSGCFNTDFASATTSTVSKDTIAYRVKDIMARALVLCWAENEKNFVLEIRNLLTDTDFKIYSPANSIKAKVEWVKQLRFDFDTMTNKLGWDLFDRKYHGGKFYG